MRRGELIGRYLRRLASILLLLALPLLSGCSAAPSFELFGAFFPAWMLCAAVGILGGIVAHAVFVANGLAYTLPHQLAVCTAIGTIAGVLTWLVAFGW